MSSLWPKGRKMKGKKTKPLLTLLVIVLGIIYQTWFSEKSNIKPESKAKLKKSSQLPISLTKHARCRMKCRKIDLDEINLALTKGKINHRKSEPHKKPCPVFSREVYSTKDRQKIRVVSADCPHKTTIITVIDLSNEYQCYCP